MKHAGAEALDTLEPLLAELRSHAGADEKKRGVFYLRSRAFLHFHEDPAGLFCDARFDPAADFERRPVNSSAERKRLLADLARTLASQGRTTP